RRVANRAGEIGVPPDESGTEIARQADDVVEDENLAVAVRTGADSDRRHRNFRRDLGREARRHALENDREAAGLGQSLRVLPGLVSRGAVPTLDLESSQLVN